MKKKSSIQRFGGNWTEKKLEKLKKYLLAYTKIMANQPFKFAYIDAFAGTGYRDNDAKDSGLFEDDGELFKGSAQIALQIEPPFNTYIFIEKDPKKVKELEKLRAEHADKDIKIHTGDANAKLCELADLNWKAHRAVLFLDPFGLQVDWATLEAIAKTRAIDMWLLFPLGVGVNRLLTKSGEITPAMRKRLDKFLGTKDWYSKFYKTESKNTLFGAEDHVEKTIDFEGLAAYFNARLDSIFAGVAPNPLMLYYKGNPLFLLCFAAANPKGATTAVKIAKQLLSTR